MRLRSVRAGIAAAITALTFASSPLALADEPPTTTAEPTTTTSTDVRSSDALSSVGPGHFAGDLLGRKVFNVPGCVPSPEHPTPVLFVHGTAGNTAMWLPAARALKKRGYCVYGWDYGKLPAREQALFPGFYGLADINDNAKELAANVERVKQMTGAKQVDLVGHSQGGTLTKKYIAQLGGADSVRRVVAAGGSFHGTTMGGMTEVAESKGGQQTRSRVRAGDQQRWNSEHIRELNTFPDTDPRVVYTSIYSPSDGVVTPYSSSMLESVGGADVANVNVEATCGGYVNHIFMPMNRKITAMVVWGLEREVGDHAPKGCRF